VVTAARSVADGGIDVVDTAVAAISDDAVSYMLETSVWRIDGVRNH
jgi:hypothetical protein